jgi:hypothetical protein
MKVEQYIATLAPSMRKDKILDDLACVRKELKEFTLPAYDSISILFDKWKWKSEEMKAFSLSFNRVVGGKGVVPTIREGLKTVLANLDVLEDLIVKTFNEELVMSAITYKKATILQYLDAVSFLSKYARRFANYMLVCETSILADSDTSIGEAFTPAELGFIGSKFLVFAQAMVALSCKPQDVIKRIEMAPEVIVKAASAAVLEQTLGREKVDPIKIGLISAAWNPFYHIGKAIAAWQVDSYNSAREELQLVQMRKLYLEKLQDKKPDAALAQEIEYAEGRVQNLNAKIAKMEADYA